ncbi:AraC family transcriptional regulator N-terminal domain-containing protein [Priestia endophytica]|nr:AraC family transcriptional regulator N-terminal domain-containing protein [Priestia endophytica]
MYEQTYKQRKELAKLIERYSGRDGTHKTAIPSLMFNRQSHITEPNFSIYNPSLCIVVQGGKRYFWHRSALEIARQIILLQLLIYQLLLKS